MSQISFPMRVDVRRRIAVTDEETHVRQMIEQVLFTSPGERVNRPDFGAALMQLVFAPAAPEVAAAVEMTVQGALQTWLGDRIRVETVQVETEGSTLRVTVQYRLRTGGAAQQATFEREA